MSTNRKKKIYRRPLPPEVKAAGSVRRRNPKKIVDRLLEAVRAGRIDLKAKKSRNTKTSPFHKEAFNFPEVDGRGVTAKRFREMYVAFTTDRGGMTHISTMEDQLCQRLAGIATMALFEEALWLSNDVHFNLDAYLELVKLQRALTSTLGIKRVSKMIGSNDDDIGVRQLLERKGFVMEGAEADA